MMDWVDHAIDSFGQTAGVPGLRLDEQGCLSFMVEGERQLTLIDLAPSGGDEVLVMVQAPLPHPQNMAVRSALQFADFRASQGDAPQVALDGDQLVATLRIARPSFLPSTLDEAMQALFRFHERVARAGSMP
jgi:type III secretion system chaperone SycN